MEELDKNEQKALLYFSGIEALKKNIYEIFSKYNAKYNDENMLFVTLFYLIVVITNSNKDIRRVVLKCKEDKLTDEESFTNIEIEKYIDKFNENFKDLSMIFLDISNKTEGNDQRFQDELVDSFAKVLLDRENMNNDELKAGLSKELTRALMVGFEFK